MQPQHPGVTAASGKVAQAGNVCLYMFRVSLISFLHLVTKMTKASRKNPDHSENPMMKQASFSVRPLSGLFPHHLSN